MGAGGGLGRSDAKKVGGKKEAAASVEPGGPREAAQVRAVLGGMVIIPYNKSVS
jgi:hypothetical protein